MLHTDLWIYVLVSVIILEKIIGHCLLKYFLCSFLTFFSWYSSYVHVTPFEISPETSNVMFLFISYCVFSLRYGLGNFYWPFFKLTDLSCHRYWWAYERPSSFLLPRFLLLRVPLDSCVVSIHLPTLPICTFTVSTRFISVHDTLIIVIVNSLSDKFNICVTFDSGSDDGFFSSDVIVCCFVFLGFWHVLFLFAEIQTWFVK